MCVVIHGQGRCPCERAPSVCDTMVSAAREAVRVAAPDALMELEREWRSLPVARLDESTSGELAGRIDSLPRAANAKGR